MYVILIKSGGIVLRIFNTTALTQKERFAKALIIGIGLAVVFIIVSTSIQKMLMLRSSVIYLLASLVIAQTLKKFGRGVQVKFAILGAILVFAVIFFSEIFIVFGYQVLLQPEVFTYAIKYVFTSWLSIDISNLISLLLKVYAIHYAYTNSRII